MDVWQVPGFTELRELGAGAQGRAVLVSDGSGRKAVLKYLLGEVSPEARDAFRRESVLLKSVMSPYVARWYGHYESPSGAAILMEAVPGRSLDKVLDRHRSLVPEAALVVMKGSLLGLAAAHGVGLVHRDYKPANVIVEDDGNSKLIDFGVATLAGEHSRSGTPSYMAPEQWAGDAAGPATDVYAATCVFFQCVTGSRPYNEPSAALLRMRHTGAPVPVEAVPEPMRALVARGMAKRPADRPASALQFVAELETAAAAGYGPDWEERGVVALAAAAVAVAALLPLSLLASSASSAVAGGAASTAAGTTTVGQTALGGLAKLAGSKLGLAVIAAVVATGAAGTYVAVKSAGPKPAPVVSTPPINVQLAAATASYPDIHLSVSDVRYPVVRGLKDVRLQQQINQEVHAPIDEAVADWRAKWNAMTPDSRTSFLQFQGPPPVHGTTRVGLTGPRLLSVGYELRVPSPAGPSDQPLVRSITVDLATGRILRPAELFRPGTQAELSSRIQPPPGQLPGSGGSVSPNYYSIDKLGLSHPQVESGFISNDGFVAISLTRQGLDAVWVSRTLDGGGHDDAPVQVPYRQIADLLSPRVRTLIRASGAAL